MKDKTENPKRFPSIETGRAYHRVNKIVGWFVVSEKVFWCYSDGSYSLTAIEPETILTAINVYC